MPDLAHMYVQELCMQQYQHQDTFAYLFLLVVSFALTPQVEVHVLEDLLDIACEAMHRRVPVAASITFQSIEYNWQNDLAVLRH